MFRGAVVLLMFLVGVVADEPWQHGTFEIRIFSVGQADAQLVILPSGFTILIDAGETNWNSRRNALLLEEKIPAIIGHKNIDVAIITHLHADHLGYVGYGGFWYLLEEAGFTFKQILDRNAGTWRDGLNGTARDGDCDPDTEIEWFNAGTTSGTARNWLCYATDQKNGNIFPFRELPVVGSETQIDPPDMLAEVTIIISDGEGVTYEDGVTSIQGDHTEEPLPPSENGYSIAVLIEYGNIRYATCGDADGTYATSSFGYTYNDVERVMAPDFGKVDIYRANHHGSRHSSSQAFVDVLNPEVSLISCGSNSFGHPDQETLGRLTPISDVYIVDVCDETRDYSNVKEIVGGDILIRSSDDGHTYQINGNTYVAGATTTMRDYNRSKVTAQRPHSARQEEDEFDS